MEKESKAVQVNLGICTSDEELDINLTSENYWELVADKKKLQLKKVLKENRKLRKLKQSLFEQYAYYKGMLEKANTFVNIIKNAINTTDDTTDVADLNSGAD